MATQYTATIRHGSLLRAPEIDCGTDFKAAQSKALNHFDDGFKGHEIVVYGQRERRAPEVYATFLIGGTGWNYY